MVSGPRGYAAAPKSCNLLSIHVKEFHTRSRMGSEGLLFFAFQKFRTPFGNLHVGVLSSIGLVMS
eukprot:574430-Amphidinium_carterae.1